MEHLLPLSLGNLHRTNALDQLKKLGASLGEAQRKLIKRLSEALKKSEKYKVESPDSSKDITYPPHFEMAEAKDG